LILLIYHDRSDDLPWLIDRMIYHDWSDDLSILLIYHDRSYWSIMINRMIYRSYWSIMIDRSDDLPWLIGWFIDPIDLSWLIGWYTMIDRMIYQTYWSIMIDRMIYWSYRSIIMIGWSIDRDRVWLIIVDIVKVRSNVWSIIISTSPIDHDRIIGSIEYLIDQSVLLQSDL